MNDNNTEGMTTIMRKEWHKVFFWKKKFWFTYIHQLPSLPLLGNKEAMTIQ